MSRFLTAAWTVLLAVATPGRAETPGSTAPRGPLAPPSETINAHSFGAKGDGKTDDTKALQSAITYGVSHRTSLVLPSGIYVTSATLRIEGSLVMRGSSHLGQGAAILEYRGTDTALLIKRPTHKPGDGHTWIYGVVLDSLAIRAPAGARIAIACAGLSESVLNNITIGASADSHFATGLLLQDSTILEIHHPVVSFTEVAFDFAGVPSRRYITNAHVTISDGDFFHNSTAFRINSLVGADIHGNWFEMHDHVVQMDDSPKNVAIEGDGISVHHNDILFNGAGLPHQTVFSFTNSAGKLARLISLRFESNRIFMSPEHVPLHSAPFQIDISSAASSDSLLYLTLTGNSTKAAAPASLISSNSLKAHIALSNNVTLDARTYLPTLPDLVGVAQLSSVRQSGSGLIIGANAEDGGGTLTIQDSRSNTQVKLRAGPSQDKPLLTVNDSRDARMGGIDAAGNFLSDRNTGHIFVGSAEGNRWRLGTIDQEHAANRGADLVIQRFSDSNTLLDTPLRIQRDTGTVLLSSLALKVVAPRIERLITIDASLGSLFVISLPDTGDHSILDPVSPSLSERITITVRHVGTQPLGLVQWGSAYKMAAWDPPASDHNRSIEFVYDGVHWIEVSRTPLDVPN